MYPFGPLSRLEAVSTKFVRPRFVDPYLVNMTAAQTLSQNLGRLDRRRTTPNHSGTFRSIPNLSEHAKIFPTKKAPMTLLGARKSPLNHAEISTARHQRAPRCFRPTIRALRLAVCNLDF